MRLLAVHALSDYSLQGDFLGNVRCDNSEEAAFTGHCGSQRLASLTSTPLECSRLRQERRSSTLAPRLFESLGLQGSTRFVQSRHARWSESLGARGHSFRSVAARALIEEARLRD
jgi:hypothetical protein